MQSLDWFDLKHYKPLKTANAAQWYDELSRRYAMLTHQIHDEADKYPLLAKWTFHVETLKGKSSELLENRDENEPKKFPTLEDGMDEIDQFERVVRGQDVKSFPPFPSGGPMFGADDIEFPIGELQLPNLDFYTRHQAIEDDWQSEDFHEENFDAEKTEKKQPTDDEIKQLYEELNTYLQNKQARISARYEALKKDILASCDANEWSQIESGLIFNGSPFHLDSEATQEETEKWIQKRDKWAQCTIHKINQPSFRLLRVDLDCPDHYLIEGFKIWLKHRRKQHPLRTKRRGPKRDFDTGFGADLYRKWVDNQIIPLLDLLIHQKYFRKQSYRNTELCELIFPDKIISNQSQAVSKAKKILDEALDSMSQLRLQGWLEEMMD